MHYYFKSAGDGIGTAAGVAWPTFGMIFGGASLAAGSGLALILGAVCIGLFALVAIPISIWSFHSYYNEKNQLRIQSALEKQKTDVELFNFFLTLSQKFLQKKSLQQLDAADTAEIVDYFQKQITKVQQHVKPGSSFDTFLNDLKDNRNNLTLLVSALIKSQHNDDEIDIRPSKVSPLQVATRALTKSLHERIQNHPVPYAPAIKTGISSFFGIFGTIAGCTAGTCGLLMGVGLFTGFTLVPVVGWIALITALTVGLGVAGLCAYQSHQNSKQAQAIKKHAHISTNLVNQRVIMQRLMDQKETFKNKYDVTRKIVRDDSRKELEPEISHQESASPVRLERKLDSNTGIRWSDSQLNLLSHPKRQERQPLLEAVDNRLQLT